MEFKTPKINRASAVKWGVKDLSCGAKMLNAEGSLLILQIVGLPPQGRTSRAKEHLIPKLRRMISFALAICILVGSLPAAWSRL